MRKAAVVEANAEVQATAEVKEDVKEGSVDIDHWLGQYTFQWGGDTEISTIEVIAFPGVSSANDSLCGSHTTDKPIHSAR